jgi:hypothetical protein
VGSLAYLSVLGLIIERAQFGPSGSSGDDELRLRTRASNNRAFSFATCTHQLLTPTELAGSADDPVSACAFEAEPYHDRAKKAEHHDALLLQLTLTKPRDCVAAAARARPKRYARRRVRAFVREYYP